MRFAIVMVVVALAFPGVASATTTSSFDSSSDTLSVALAGASASTLVGCGTSTHNVTVGGADPSTGSVSYSAVKAIIVTGDDGQDSISLAGVSSTMYTSLTGVTANTGGGNDNYFGSPIGDTVNMGASANAGGDVVTPGSGDDHIACPGGCQVNEDLTGTSTLTDTASSDPGGLGGVDSLSGVTSLDAETSGNNVNVDASGANVPIRFDGIGNSAGQVFRGGSGDDLFNISAGSASIDGGSGSNSLIISPGTDGKVTLTPTNLTASVTATLRNIQNASITGGNGNNVYDWSAFDGPVVLSDPSGDDTVTAGAGNDSITLLGGEGSVNAGGGDDQIYLSGDPTSYSIAGGSGSNTLTWAERASGTLTATDSELTTPDGPITLSNIGALTLQGTNGNDVFDARAFSGPVTIEGEGGQDVMLGGPGADSFTGFSDSTDCFNGGPGADTIDGGGSTSDSDVVDPADTLVSGSTYTSVSTCGYGDSAPSGSSTTGGGSGPGGGSGDSTPPAASAQIAAWGTRFSPSTYGGSVTVIGFATDPSPSSGTATIRCSLDPATAPAGYDDLGAGACTQLTTSVGSHTFYVAARDPAGNTSTIASVSFQVVAVPDTTITGGPMGSTWSAVPQYAFTSTIPGSSFACSVDGGPASPCTSPRAAGPFAAGSTHTFSVSAKSPAGFVDPTPARATFTVNATQVTTRACEITPRPANFPLPPPSVDLGCMVRFAIPDSCGPNYRCIHLPDGCPANASCTLTTKSTWVDGDTGPGWIIPAWSTLTSTTNPSIVSGGLLYVALCDEPVDNRFCTAQSTRTLVGPATMQGVCNPVQDRFAGLGSDADRDLKCSVTATITPAAPLLPITVRDGIDVFVPAAGKLILGPGGGAGAHASAIAAKHTTKHVAPVFKTTTDTVASAGVVHFTPKLSAAAKASFRRHRKLSITLRMVFVPKHGGASRTRSYRATLKATPSEPSRCLTVKARYVVRKTTACRSAGKR